MKWLRRLLYLLLVAGVAVAGGMRLVGDDAAVWHVDPATAQRTGKPNGYLIAPEGSTLAETDAVFAPRAVAAKDLLFQFDAIASRAGRTTVLAGSVDAGQITYVQRSMVFGFPDYITVKAVEAGAGAGLIIWSRARFGHSDMDVNRQRIEDWLAKMGGSG